MTPIRTLRPLAKVVLSTQSDERLVALSRQGSEDAFAEIVRRHRPGLLRFARSLGMGDRADDVVQDGLVRAWRALRKSDAEIDLRPWLTTIVRNRALTSHSTNRAHEELDETIDGVRQPGDIVIMREELRSAVSAVNSLPDSQREALVRSALSGESHDQIASALATTPGAVRQLIFRARTGLREAVGAIVPFPLVRSLADLSAGGAAAGGTAAALTAGGASFGLKALALVAVGATVAGSGIAIERHTSGAEAKDLTSTTPAAESSSAAGEAASAPAALQQPPAGGDQSSTSAAESANAAVVDAKSSDATRSAALVAGDSRESGSPRVAESDNDNGGNGDPAGAETGGDATTPAATEPNEPQPHQQQQPPQQPAGGHQPQQPDQNNPPPNGGGQQPPPSPPPPPAGNTDTSDNDGHHPGQGGTAPQPQPTDAHDAHGGDGSGPGALGDLIPAD
jgi:RNA polymerase sigma factor (sigma-70 family)